MPYALAALLIYMASGIPAYAASAVTNGLLRYNGFTIDMAGAAKANNLDAIETSLKKQIDIVVGCGAKPDIIAFFRKQKITLGPKAVSGHDDGGGHFVPGVGIELNAAPQPADKPILLHELLHAFHTYQMPGGAENAQITQFYDNAVSKQIWPATESFMRNKVEFFAVTASLYLWGYVARLPNNRETLRARQPLYYKWLGQLFGVEK